jgi:hypothetical protein
MGQLAANLIIFGIGFILAGMAFFAVGAVMLK